MFIFLPCKTQTAGTEQQLCVAGTRCHTETYGSSLVAVLPPSALLIATARVLHLVVARLESEPSPPGMLATALDRAISGSSVRLLDKMMLCACLGALTAEGEAVNRKLCLKIISTFTYKGSYDAVFITLEQVMQV